MGNARSWDALLSRTIWIPVYGWSVYLHTLSPGHVMLDIPHLGWPDLTDEQTNQPLRRDTYFGTNAPLEGPGLFVVELAADGQTKVYPDALPVDGGSTPLGTADTQSRYHHPFFRNAMTPAQLGYTPPLMVWTQHFINGLQDQYTARLNNPTNSIPNPSTYRYYFDTEYNVNNSVAEFYSLWLLVDAYQHPAVHSSIPNGDASWWHMKPVPGFGTKTLEQLYADEQAARAHTADAWPVTISLTLSRNGSTIDWARSTNLAANAPFFRWYDKIFSTARQFAINQCVYQVIRDKWPNAGIKCGNHTNGTTDRKPDTFSWFQDLSDMGGGDVEHGGADTLNINWPRQSPFFGNDVVDPSVGCQSFPVPDTIPSDVNARQFSNHWSRQASRTFAGTGAGKYLFNVQDRHNDGTFELNGFSQQPFFGDVDSPAFYIMLDRWTETKYDADCNVTGYSCNPSGSLRGFRPDVWLRGWQQKNAYIPLEKSYPDDCLAASDDAQRDSFNKMRRYSMLLNYRFTSESILNSDYAPSGQHLPYGNMDRLLPWIWQPRGGGLYNTPEEQQGLTPNESWPELARDTLCMLRAKNVGEILWFTNGTSCTDAGSADAWESTRAYMRDAYAAEVESVRICKGHTIIDAPGESTADFPDCLSFTLRKYQPNGASHERTVNLAYIQDPDITVGHSDFVGDPPPAATGVAVTMKIGNPPESSRYECPQYLTYNASNGTFSTNYKFEVRLECKGPTAANARGEVFAVNYHTNPATYMPLRIVDDPWGFDYGTGSYPYVFLRDDGDVHLTFTMSPAQAAAAAQMGSDGLVRMTLLFGQSVPNTFAAPAEGFISRYDLVQLTPVWQGCFGSLLGDLGSSPGAAEYVSEDLALLDGHSGPQLMLAESLPAIPPEATTSPAFLNSAFCHLTPSCGSGDPCYTLDKHITLHFTGPVRAGSGLDPAIFVRKVDGDPAFNYATLMNITIKHVTDSEFSRDIVLQGNGSTLLVPGIYEISAITDSNGAIVSPVGDSLDPADARPVQPFTYVFTLLSDCNLNGRLDYSDDGSIVTDINMDPSLDWWPYDHMIDACHPELCEPDFNGDGNIDQGDVDTLIAIIGGDWSNAAPHADPDFNRDGNPDQGDVDALINTVAGNGCP